MLMNGYINGFTQNERTYYFWSAFKNNIGETTCHQVVRGKHSKSLFTEFGGITIFTIHRPHIQNLFWWDIILNYVWISHDTSESVL